jgi:hypothetical protein
MSPSPETELASLNLSVIFYNISCNLTFRKDSMDFEARELLRNRVLASPVSRGSSGQGTGTRLWGKEDRRPWGWGL